MAEPFPLSYRRSIFFSWLIRASVHKSRLSTLFPAMASLSTALSLSSTAGMWEKLLNERLKLLSCASPPSSSGSELRRFPSRDSVCRLTQRKDCRILYWVQREHKAHFCKAASCSTVLPSSAGRFNIWSHWHLSVFYGPPRLLISALNGIKVQFFSCFAAQMEKR